VSRARRRPPPTKTSAPGEKTGPPGIRFIRDTWGIPHVYGKTDSGRCLGVAYAPGRGRLQPVETNFINSQAGSPKRKERSELYRDLRMKIFIDTAA